MALWLSSKLTSAVQNFAQIIGEEEREEEWDDGPDSQLQDPVVRTDSGPVKVPVLTESKARVLAATGCSPEVVEFVQALCEHPMTWSAFPLDASSNAHRHLPPFMKNHAKTMLQLVPDLKELRYHMVPRKMKEDDFWTVYFLLVSNKMRALRASAPDAVSPGTETLLTHIDGSKNDSRSDPSTNDDDAADWTKVNEEEQAAIAQALSIAPISGRSTPVASAPRPAPVDTRIPGPLRDVGVAPDADSYYARRP